MSKFHLRLRELRNSRKLSQQELADYLRISKSSINMYERGEREPGLDTLEAIADFFNVDMDYLSGKTLEIKSFTAAPVTDNQLKFALFGTTDIDDELLEDVKKIAQIQLELKKKKGTK